MPVASRSMTSFCGGHLIDPKSQISRVCDIAVAEGKMAASPPLNPADALKVVDVGGLYVTPGLIDIHVHVTPARAKRDLRRRQQRLPGRFHFRGGRNHGGGCRVPGWRNFPDFKQRVIDRSKTRVLAFLNIVGQGMGGGPSTRPRRHGAPTYGRKALRTRV